MKWPKLEYIFVPTALVLLMVLMYFLDFKNISQQCLGIQPYHYSGLKGIILAPLLHSDIPHLVSNIFPLWALIFLSFEFYDKLTYWVLILGWIFTGLMVWAFPFPLNPYYSSTCHIGASGLVYVFAFFLLFSSIFDRKKSLNILTLVIVVSFGSMVWGVLPEEFFGIKDSHISWQSHLSGAIVGVILSYVFKGKSVIEEKKFDWEGKSELNEKDQALWDRYNSLLKEQEQEELIERQQEEIRNYFKEENQNST